MFTLRRWWDKNALKLAGFGTVIGATYLLLQSQNALVFEVYNALSQPFQSSPRQLDYLKTARVEQLQNEIQELKQQNQQLKQLTSYSASVPNKAILAPVVLRSADNWWQQIVIGRGSADGIAIDYIVVGTGGVVGRVISVSPHTSRVLLVSDPSNRMGVLVSRTRNLGILQGTRTNQAVLQFFDKRPSVKIGDVVSTSAVSQLFPTGLSVGRIVETNLNKSPAPEAIVEFTAPFNALEWVTVHSHNPHAVVETPIKPELKAPPADTLTKPPAKLP
ncbi:rod shape-determining protein MreC [Chamaesiphon sp. OTE_75_metabat_556]|uniref:rod shape-determining protein MreC n=1 Tax=Chamaesiphon sp. OTE_75_metabat_556 TaxID=2964692 RepID=UPI00286AF35F|nr:rod shape-determining protein MreC [Chamaesiphon sp. OTE_75_metabat_556]